MGIDERAEIRQIDGFEYEVKPLPTGIGTKLLLKFIKLAGPVLGEALSGVGDLNAASAAGGAFRLLADTVKEDDLEYFRTTLGSKTRILEPGSVDKNGEPLWIALTPAKQDTHFAGNYIVLFDWLRFAMEVNYGSFFAELMRRMSETASKKSDLKAPPVVLSTSPLKTGSSSVS